VSYHHCPCGGVGREGGGPSQHFYYVDAFSMKSHHYLSAAQVDITFPLMPCSWLSLDTMDVSGDLHLDVVSGGMCFDSGLVMDGLGMDGLVIL